MSAKDFADRLPAAPSPAGLLDALKYDAEGLLTVVVQDAASREVLMVAHANREAVEKTLWTGLMHYYSRSRKKLWLKGEESGHVQKVARLTVDCDGDAILAEVEQTSGACHLGYRSCFSWRIEKDGKVSVTGVKVFDPAAAYRKKA